MEGDTGLTIFEPSEIKLNIIGNEEEDEEAIEDQKRRAQMLEAQLENAFDDWSDEDDTIDKHKNQNICSSPKSSTDDDDDINVTNDKGRVRNILMNSKASSRGKLLHKLSDISERSVNKSHLSDNSGVFSSGTDLSPSTGELTGSIDGQREYEKQNEPIFKNIPFNKSGDKFVPLFVKTQVTRGSPGNENTYRQAASGELIFKNDGQTGEKFQPFFIKSPSVEQSFGENENAYKQAELSSQNQIEVLYQIRLKEIQRLTAQLEAERSEAADYKQRTLMQMALLQSEKERAILSRTEADKLLVASKEEISNLEKEVSSLKQVLEAVQKEKEQSCQLLELSRVEIQELEDRMALMERCDNSMRLSKQSDLMVKNLKTRHQEELSLLQSQLDTVSKKLLVKEEESRSLQQRLDQLTVDKAATISQLTHSLEDSQRQCQQLLETNVMVENVELNHQLNQLCFERDQLTKTVNSLQEECRSLKSELETISPTDSMVQLGISQSRSRSNDTSTNLKAELHRALLNQKAKRSELVHLQNILSDKEKEIQDMKTLHEATLAEKEALDIELRKMNEELLSVKSEYEELKNTYNKLQDNAPVNKKEYQELQKKTGNETLSAKRESYLEEEASVRLDQSLKEVKVLKEKYLEVTTELGMLKGQLQQVTEERDNVNTKLEASLNQVDLLLKDKNGLLFELKKLKDDMANNLENIEDKNLRLECDRLHNELSTMSARHAQELSSARTELLATRDRVSQLERTTRLQFETKIRTLQQERDLLKSKFEEQETQIKKLIESRKRIPSTASVATETEIEMDGREKLEMELAHCRAEYEANLAYMKKVHQDVVVAMQQKLAEEKENFNHIHLRSIAEFEQQLKTVEEQTKEKTIHFFSEKVQELETKYQEQLKQVSNPAEVVRLKTEIADQSRQNEILSASLERANQAVHTKMKELAIERETEKRHMALLIEQWSQEMKFAQEELKLKDDNIKQLKLKLESAKYCAKTNFEKLVKTNKEIIESTNNKLSLYRSKVKTNVENYEKDVWEKVQKIESIYRRREKRLYQEFKKQLMVEL